MESLPSNEPRHFEMTLDEMGGKNKNKKKKQPYKELKEILDHDSQKR